MASLTPEQREKGVICSSAGNHAQGVALAGRTLVRILLLLFNLLTLVRECLS